MIPRIFISLFLLGFFLPGFFASAQTPQIEALQAQIKALEAQLKALQAGQPQPAAVAPAKSSTVSAVAVSAAAARPEDFFTKNLGRGSTGEEVSRLQVAMKQFRDVYPEGIVSGYYGTLTENAVKKFQKKYDIEQVGVVGPKTRKALNNVSTRLAAAPKSTPAPGAGAIVLPTGGLEPSQVGATAFEPFPTPTPSLPQPTASPAPGGPYFKYSWRATSTSFLGEVYLPTPAPRPVVVLGGKATQTLNTDAAVRLAQVYHVVLSDDKEPWDEFTAGMLFEMIRRLDEIWMRFGIGSKPWRVSLTKDLLPQDFEATSVYADVAVRHVTFTKAAFTFSNPLLQPSDEGSPDRVFYSNRLFRATLAAFFNERSLLNAILQQRYGLQTGYVEPKEDYQDFSEEELQYLLSVLEDLPAGYRHMPGLYKIVRRRQGTTNPDIPSAAALAYVDAGYMEFTDFAFRTPTGSRYPEDTIRKIIAHEFTHFLWAKVLDQKAREAWAALSGWTLSYVVGANLAEASILPDHPKARYVGPPQPKWYRMTSTNFVSAYAAHKNPEEDFSETMAYYIYQPDYVRTIAPEKYEFLKKITVGYEYVILVEERFTFQVFNLDPDITFPGKIIGVDVEVYKLPNGDNRVLATLTLAKIGEGAAYAYARLLAPVGDEMKRFHARYISFSPLPGDPYTLRADMTINKYAGTGYWAPQQIIVQDRVDHKRFESQNQFGWLLFINNPEEDLEPPVADTTGIRGEQTIIDGDEAVIVRIPARDNSGKLSAWATLHQYDSNHLVNGSATYDEKAQIVTFTYIIRKYKASGIWTFREFWLEDPAGNEARYDLAGKAATFLVRTQNPDYAKPKLDINSIKIKAVPTKPEAPDGETKVTIWYSAWDDIAGLSSVSFSLLKPTGDGYGTGHSHPDFSATYWPGNPKEVRPYEHNFTLPVGSPPGTWVLRNMTLQDKAGNGASFEFTETGILRPFDVR